MKKVGVVILIYCLLSGCATMTGPDKAAASAAILDLTTTAIGGSQGCTESNPLMGKEIDATMLLTSASLSAGVGWALHKWGKDRVTWGYTGIRGAAGLHNLTVIGGCGE